MAHRENISGENKYHPEYLTEPEGPLLESELATVIA